MDSSGQSLLKLLFNDGETICVSDNRFAYHSMPLENTFGGKITLVSSNKDSPIRHCDSSKLILVSINPIKGFRCDKNVTAFRSFLVELDIGSTKEQLTTIKRFGMPFSAQVFSGNKSVHTVITLSEDLKDKRDYSDIANWIFNIITLADKNCANPSRGARIPGAYREPNKKQELISINRRITHKELFSWLNQYEHLRPRAKEKRIMLPGQADYSRLSPWARGMLTKGMEFKIGRNQTWFGLAVDFALAGFSEDETIDNLGKHFVEEHDFKEKEWLASIRSAFKYVSEGK